MVTSRWQFSCVTSRAEGSGQLALASGQKPGASKVYLSSCWLVFFGQPLYYFKWRTCLCQGEKYDWF